MRGFIALLLLAAGAAQAGYTVRVDADARPGGTGSWWWPYRTLEEARDGIRSARKSGALGTNEEATVKIAAGEYRLDRSFALERQDSGVTYRGASPERVRFIGGVTLRPEWFQPLTDVAALAKMDAAVKGKVFVCDLAAYGVTNAFPAFKTAFRGVPVAPWLYADGEPMTLARWPNDGWAKFSKAVDNGKPDPNSSDPEKREPHAGSFVFDDARPGRWDLGEGVWLLGYWTHDWSDEVIRIAAYDKDSKVISLAAPHTYGINAGTWGAKERRFFAENALSELDAPGEWWLDRKAGRLYFYPVHGLKDSRVVLATLTEPMVRMQGVKDLKMEGISFGCTHGTGIVMDNTEGVEIAGCHIADCAGQGIFVNGRGCTIRSCDLWNLGTSGIDLYGGDREKLVRAENLAVNNHIHHYGLFQRTYAPGIGANGCGQIVRNNCIHDAPHNAVLYGGNENQFIGNEIYRVVMETGDSGAFYTGRDWTTQGNVLSENFIHHLGSYDKDSVNTMGVYLDDCDCGDTLIGNVFWKAGRAIMIGGGRDNPVLDNFIIDCPIGLHIDSRGMTWPNWNKKDDGWWLEGKAEKLNYRQPPWSTRYPHLANIMNDSPQEPLYNPVRGNTFIDCSRSVADFDKNVRELLPKFDIASNTVVSTTGETNAFASVCGVKGFTCVVEKGAARTLPKAGGRFGLFVDKYRRVLPKGYGE